LKRKTCRENLDFLKHYKKCQKSCTDPLSYIKYLVKSYADHTVNSTASVIEKMIAIYKFDKNLANKIIKLVEEIVSNQKRTPKYDYMTNEQLEIDKLVYKMYNLNEEDIKEVENWYFRRYPKLAKIIEEKLKQKKLQITQSIE
jgi:hypothetical protein